MKKMLVGLFICLIAGSANAGLVLNISEDINNNVLFEFSGSDTVNQGANIYRRNGFWFGDITDDIYGGTAASYTPLTDSFLAENTTQDTTSTLRDIYLNGGVGHELGIRLSNWSILTTASDGDLITWSGQATLALDFSDFMQGTWTGNSLNAGGSDELILLGDGYTITVGDPAPVPEPTTMLLFGTGMACLVAVGRKKRK